MEENQPGSAAALCATSKSRLVGAASPQSVSDAVMSAPSASLCAIGPSAALRALPFLGANRWLTRVRFPPSMSQPPSLSRRFGMLQATALNMTNMMGVGPFVTIPLLMTALGGPQAMLGWLVALLIVIPDGMVWSELGSAMPGSGGSYVYLREGFGREKWGRLAAFLFIWQFIFSGPLEIASGYIGFAQYAGYLWPAAAAHGGAIVAIAVGILNIV